jgi:aldehyde:ferredoxin oxidoreductase
LPKLQKVVPKGAQRKFSAQKSFLRECRAKYRRNIRRRSSKVVPKGMQNLYRRNRRRRSSKVVPKGMQNLHRKINGEHQKISGEEAQKSFLRGCRACVFQCGRVGVCLRHPHHFASYHYIISYNMTSYIILHQQHEN